MASDLMLPTASDEADVPVVDGLCRRCEQFKFNDSCGFGTVDPLFGRAKPWLEIPGREMLHSYLLPGVNFTDELPSLPLLHRAAKAGCGFCGFLRQAILDAGLGSDTTTCKARLNYVWGDFVGGQILKTRPRTGLTRLRCRLAMEPPHRGNGQILLMTCS